MGTLMTRSAQSTASCDTPAPVCTSKAWAAAPPQLSAPAFWLARRTKVLVAQDKGSRPGPVHLGDADCGVRQVRDCNLEAHLAQALQGRGAGSVRQAGGELVRCIPAAAGLTAKQAGTSGQKCMSIHFSAPALWRPLLLLIFFLLQQGKPSSPATWPTAAQLVVLGWLTC